MSTRKFLCLQKSVPRPAAEAQPGTGDKPSAAEMQQMYERFNTWRETFADNIVDLGAQLTGPMRVASEDDIEGTAVESREVFGGYMIIAADSLEQAVEIARGCPGIVSPGSNLVVREIAAPA
ncbi:YciI family protein [Devosia sp.]|uniref:YciI family protein n=1 Tax=Devosia sp. TaxID=1871048 RepID=UPI003A919A33